MAEPSFEDPHTPDDDREVSLDEPDELPLDDETPPGPPHPEELEYDPASEPQRGE